MLSNPVRQKSHPEIAGELFLKGYNCSQSVFAAFCDITGIDFDTSLKLSSAFGGGMGRMREVCGACSGMFLVLGALYGYSDPNEKALKAELYNEVQMLAGDFRSCFGTIICRELLASCSLPADASSSPTERTESFYKERPCVRCIKKAAELLDKFIMEKDKTL